MNPQDLHNFQLDLIENESFIQWVNSEFELDDEKWSTFIDQHPDQYEDINKAIGFVRTMTFRDDDLFRQKETWDKIAASTQIKSETKPTLRPFFNKQVKIISILAAACLLLFLVYRLGISSATEVKTEFASQIKTLLPDGSSIIISPDSKISFNKKSWDQNRSVQLTGTAFFEVKKGSTFTVKTELGSVIVLGTSFSVTTRNNNFEVICKTGKVAVKLNQNPKNEAILLPGDMVRMHADTLRFQSGSSGQPHVISWLDGLYTFESQPLSEVIDELRRQYDVNVIIPKELSQLTYTGFFKKDNLNEALYSITWPLGLKYDMDKKGNITISK